MIGANRLGKTVAAAGMTAGCAIGVPPLRWAELPGDVTQWTLGPPRRIWCITTTHEKSRTIQQRALWERIPRRWWRNEWRGDASGFHNGVGLLRNGSSLGFKSSEQKLTEFESDTLDLVWIDETVPHEYFLAALPRLVDRRGQLIWTTIPDAPELHELFVQRRLSASAEPMPAESIGWITGAMRENPHLHPEEVALLEAALPAYERDLRIRGQFVVVQGLVYEDFRDALHLESVEWPVPADWTRYEAIDPGWRNPCAVLFAGVDSLGGLHLYDEIYERQRTVGEIAALIWLKRWTHRGLLSADEIATLTRLAQRRPLDTPEDVRAHAAADAELRAVLEDWRRRKGDWRPRLTLIDEAGGQRDQAKPVPAIELFRQFGIVGRPASNAQKREQRLAVRQYLRPLAGRIRLRVNYDCRWLRYEFAHFRMADARDAGGEYAGDVERVEPRHNHLMACLEYLVDARPTWQPPEAAPPSGTVARNALDAERREQRREKPWHRRG